MCGLKHSSNKESEVVHEVTPFVGVWIETAALRLSNSDLAVTPFVGVWIETLLPSVLQKIAPSHPSWVCGLKRGEGSMYRKEESVTPFVGVWIETLFSGSSLSVTSSHPSWVCGLKLSALFQYHLLLGHTLRGCVD